MIITGFEFKNFGPHEHLKVETDESVVAILGDNGKGKTRILKGIDFAFTGNLDQNQKDCVCNFAVDKDGEPVTNGWIKVFFRQGGSNGEIFRQVGTSPRRYLIWDGEDKITSQADMDAKLSEILNCDKRAMSLAVFLAQGNIGGFLFLTPAEREKEFARMMLIDHLPKVSETIDQELSNIRRLITDHGSTIDEVTEQLKVAESATHIATLKVNDAGNYTDEVDWLNSVTRAGQSLEERRSEKSAAEGEVTSAESKLKAVKAPEGVTEDDLDPMRERQEKHREAWHEVERVTSKLSQAEAAAARIKVLKDNIVDVRPILTEISEVDAQIANQSLIQSAHEARKIHKESVEKHRTACENIEKTIAETNEKIDNKRVEVEKLEKNPKLVEGQAQITRLEGRLELIQKAAELVDGNATCPVCAGCEVKSEGLTEVAEGIRLEIEEASQANSSLRTARQDLGNLEERSESLLEDLKPHKARLTEASEDLTQAEAKVAAVGEFKAADVADLNKHRAALASKLNSYTASKESIERETSLLNEHAPDGIEKLAASMKAAEEACLDEATAKKLSEDIAEMASFLRNSRALKQDVDSAKAILSKSFSSVKSAEKNLKDLESSTPSSIKKEDAGYPELLEKYKDKQRESNRLQGELDQATKNLRRLEERLAEVNSLVKNQGEIRNLITDLERIKGLFGRQGIQRKYLDDMFGALAALTAQNLSNWDCDFMVREDPEQACNFLFSKADKPEIWMDQSQLSGGQRIRLAISFLLGVQRLVFPDLGFLVLDEPSTHLDKSGREDLREFFRTLARHMEHHDSQVFVVDHDEELRPAFKKVITLD